MSVELRTCDATSLLSEFTDADLVFMDPPFNIGEPYVGFSDQVSDWRYCDQLRSWIYMANRSIKPTGSIWVHLPDRWAPDAVMFARSIGLVQEGWIIWHFRFGSYRSNRFINSKCHGLWFSKGSPKVNTDAMLVPSDRELYYSDLRSPSGERPDLDVWGFERFWGRVQGNNKERRPLHPNQLPELYIKRIVEVTTDVGDLVVDPFCGSGTTAVVANSLGRSCATGDVSTEAIESARERIAKGAVRC